jgi:ribulose-phosphate 3-epimerase
MISPVDPLIDAFADAGADVMTVHPEAGPHLHRTLQRIKAHGIKAGVALNPASPLSLVEPVLDLIDLVLVMSVNPGFGGQSYIESATPRIAALRRMIDGCGRDIVLEVDGGVTPATAPAVYAAGADMMVAGTAAFKGGADHYAANLSALKAACT